MNIEYFSLVSWVLVGIIGGVITALINGGRRMIVYDIIIGILGSIAGGWGSAIVVGDNSQYLYIITVLTGLFVAALALWLFNALLIRSMTKTRRRRPRRD